MTGGGLTVLTRRETFRYSMHAPTKLAVLALVIVLWMGGEIRVSG